MRRFAAALLAVLALVGSGCGEDEPKLDYPAREVKTPDPTTVGSVAGTIRFAGEAPSPRFLNTACGGGGQVPDETLLVQDGKLANALVYISEGAEDFVFPWAKDEVTIDQTGCRFIPHVVALRARQPIRVHNSDPLAHNINVGARTQPGFVVSFPGPGTVLRQLARPELSIRTTCDLHANMLMYIHVLDHPFFAVTGPDGRFEIEGLAPGTYRLGVRHEELGEQSRTLVIPESGRIENFDFSYAR